MKKIAAVCLLMSAGAIALLYYYWLQVTKIPTWYTQQATKESNGNIKNKIALQQAKDNVEAKITDLTPQAANSKNVELQLNENELNSLVASELAKKANRSKLAEAVKAVKINIKDGKIESGAVVRISEIPTARLKAEERTALTKVVEAFPNLENKELYVAVEGKPTVKNGQLKLDENSRIKLGELSFTTAQLSQRLGIPESKLKQITNLELNLGRLKVIDIKLTDGKASIRGSLK